MAALGPLAEQLLQTSETRCIEYIEAMLQIQHNASGPTGTDGAADAAASPKHVQEYIVFYVVGKRGTGATPATMECRRISQRRKNSSVAPGNVCKTDTTRELRS